MCDMQKMPTREDASCEEDSDMNFATFSAVSNTGAHFVTTGGQLPVAKLQQNVTNNGTGMPQVCVAMSDSGMQYMRALDGSVQATPQLISLPITLAGSKPGDPQPTVQIQVLSPSMLQAQQQPKYQMQIPIQGYQQGGAVLTVAYSPDSNETSGLQLVGQGSLGEGLQVLAALPHEMQLVQQTQEKDHMQQNMHQVFITPNQQIIINSPENKTLNNNTTSDNNNSGPMDIIIKEECDEANNDDESSRGAEAGETRQWQLNQCHQQDLVKYLSTLPPQQAQGLPASLQQFLRLNPTDVKKTEPVEIEIEMDDVTDDKKEEEPVAEAVLSEGKLVGSSTEKRQEKLEEGQDIKELAQYDSGEHLKDCMSLGNHNRGMGCPNKPGTRTEQRYDTFIKNPTNNKPPEIGTPVLNPSSEDRQPLLVSRLMTNFGSNNCESEDFPLPSTSKSVIKVQSINEPDLGTNSTYDIVKLLEDIPLPPMPKSVINVQSINEPDLGTNSTYDIVRPPSLKEFPLPPMSKSIINVQSINEPDLGSNSRCDIVRPPSLEDISLPPMPKSVINFQSINDPDLGADSTYDIVRPPSLEDIPLPSLPKSVINVQSINDPDLGTNSTYDIVRPLFSVDMALPPMPESVINVQSINDPDLGTNSTYDIVRPTSLVDIPLPPLPKSVINVQSINEPDLGTNSTYDIVRPPSLKEFLLPPMPKSVINVQSTKEPDLGTNSTHDIVRPPCLKEFPLPPMPKSIINVQSINEPTLGTNSTYDILRTPSLEYIPLPPMPKSVINAQSINELDPGTKSSYEIVRPPKEYPQITNQVSINDGDVSGIDSDEHRDEFLQNKNLKKNETVDEAASIEPFEYIHKKKKAGKITLEKHHATNVEKSETVVSQGETVPENNQKDKYVKESETIVGQDETDPENNQEDNCMEESETIVSQDETVSENNQEDNFMEESKTVLSQDETDTENNQEDNSEMVDKKKDKFNRTVNNLISKTEEALENLREFAELIKKKNKNKNNSHRKKLIRKKRGILSSPQQRPPLSSKKRPVIDGPLKNITNKRTKVPNGITLSHICEAPCVSRPPLPRPPFPPSVPRVLLSSLPPALSASLPLLLPPSPSLSRKQPEATLAGEASTEPPATRPATVALPLQPVLPASAPQPSKIIELTGNIPTVPIVRASTENQSQPPFLPSVPQVPPLSLPPALSSSLPLLLPPSPSLSRKQLEATPASVASSECSLIYSSTEPPATRPATVALSLQPVLLTSVPQPSKNNELTGNIPTFSYKRRSAKNQSIGLMRKKRGLLSSPQQRPPLSSKKRPAIDGPFKRTTSNLTKIPNKISPSHMCEAPCVLPPAPVQAPFPPSVPQVLSPSLPPALSPSLPLLFPPRPSLLRKQPEATPAGEASTEPPATRPATVALPLQPVLPASVQQPSKITEVTGHIPTVPIVRPSTEKQSQPPFPPSVPQVLAPTLPPALSPSLTLLSPPSPSLSRKQHEVTPASVASSECSLIYSSTEPPATRPATVALSLQPVLLVSVPQPPKNNELTGNIPTFSNKRPSAKNQSIGLMRKKRGLLSSPQQRPPQSSKKRLGIEGPFKRTTSNLTKISNKISPSHMCEAPCVLPPAPVQAPFPPSVPQVLPTSLSPALSPLLLLLLLPSPSLSRKQPEATPAVEASTDPPANHPATVALPLQPVLPASAPQPSKIIELTGNIPTVPIVRASTENQSQPPFLPSVPQVPPLSLPPALSPSLPLLLPPSPSLSRKQLEATPASVASSECSLIYSSTEPPATRPATVALPLQPVLPASVPQPSKITELTGNIPTVPIVRPSTDKQSQLPFPPSVPRVLPPTLPPALSPSLPLLLPPSPSLSRKQLEATPASVASSKCSLIYSSTEPPATRPATVAPSLQPVLPASVPQPSKNNELTGNITTILNKRPSAKNQSIDLMRKKRGLLSSPQQRPPLSSKKWPGIDGSFKRTTSNLTKIPSKIRPSHICESPWVLRPAPVQAPFPLSFPQVPPPSLPPSLSPSLPPQLPPSLPPSLLPPSLYLSRKKPEGSPLAEKSKKPTKGLERYNTANILLARANKRRMCECLYDCHLKFDSKQHRRICREFHNICSFKKQSLYLKTLLTACIRDLQSTTIIGFNYYIPNQEGKKIRVCKTFFKNTFALSENRLISIQQLKNMHGCVRWTRYLDGTLRIHSKKKKKYKKKPAKPSRPKPGQVVIATALDGSPIFCCPECQMAYPEKEQLEIHLIVHKIERRFICGICGAGLKRKEHLERHKLGHNPERPYVCGVCRKGFKRREHLNLHTVIHSGVKTEMCTECGKGFYRKDHLRKHTRSHESKRARDEAAGDSSPAPAQPSSGNNSLMPEITIHIPTSSNSQMPVQINIPQHVVSSLAASQQQAAENAQSTLDALLAQHS